jgi:hypothetical protein
VGAVYVAVLLPVGAIVPRAAPVALHTALEFEAAARLQLTALLLVPLTAAVNCTVLAVALVLTGMDAGVDGEAVNETATLLPPPPLLGACAMQPANGSTAANVTNEIIRLNCTGLALRTGASLGLGNSEMVWGDCLEVYRVACSLSRMMCQRRAQHGVWRITDSQEG